MLFKNDKANKILINLSQSIIYGKDVLLSLINIFNNNDNLKSYLEDDNVLVTFEKYISLYDNILYLRDELINKNHEQVDQIMSDTFMNNLGKNKKLLLPDIYNELNNMTIFIKDKLKAMDKTIIEFYNTYFNLLIRKQNKYLWFILLYKFKYDVEDELISHKDAILFEKIFSNLYVLINEIENPKIYEYTDIDIYGDFQYNDYSKQFMTFSEMVKDHWNIKINSDKYKDTILSKNASKYNMPVIIFYGPSSYVHDINKLFDEKYIVNRQSGINKKIIEKSKTIIKTEYINDDKSTSAFIKYYSSSGNVRELNKRNCFDIVNFKDIDEFFNIMNTKIYYTPDMVSFMEVKYDIYPILFGFDYVNYYNNKLMNKEIEDLRLLLIKQKVEGEDVFDNIINNILINISTAIENIMFKNNYEIYKDTDKYKKIIKDEFNNAFKLYQKIQKINNDKIIRNELNITLQIYILNFSNNLIRSLLPKLIDDNDDADNADNNDDNKNNNNDDDSDNNNNSSNVDKSKININEKRTYMKNIILTYMQNFCLGKSNILLKIEKKKLYLVLKQ